MKVQDPYRSLRSRHDTAVALALKSEAAQYIQYTIAEHLVEVEQELQDGNQEAADTAFMRGYRMALRVAFIVAGGDVDGSEQQWAQAVAAARG